MIKSGRREPVNQQKVTLVTTQKVTLVTSSRDFRPYDFPMPLY
jgi:hypothetical protein